jgi:hypothetical protein
MKFFFVKIWSLHVENHHNYHRPHYENFHYSYDNIQIVDDGKYVISKKKLSPFFEKKKIIRFVNVENWPYATVTPKCLQLRFRYLGYTEILLW